jgi:hypothetical protein
VTRPLKPLEMGSIANRFLRMKLRGKKIRSQKSERFGSRTAAVG